jgi:hypothetical protein
MRDLRKTQVYIRFIPASIPGLYPCQYQVHTCHIYQAKLSLGPNSSTLTKRHLVPITINWYEKQKKEKPDITTAKSGMFKS